jgi:hypothetical protein
MTILVVKQWSAPGVAPPPVRRPVERAPVASAPCFSPATLPQPAVVSLTFQRVSVDSREILVKPQLCLSVRFVLRLRKLVSLGPGRAPSSEPIASLNTSETAVVFGPAARLSLGVDFYIPRYGLQISRTVLPRDLTLTSTSGVSGLQISSNSVLTAGMDPVTLPLTGTSTNYPRDRYYTDGMWFLTLPSDVRTKDVSSVYTGTQLANTVPLKPQARVAPALHDFSVDIGAADVATPGDVLVVIGRLDQAKVFVFGLLCVPLLLAIALLTHVASLSARGNIDVLIGVGAILVALLPLRLVLVPTDIVGVTLVDVVLGTEVSILAAIAIWSVPVASLRGSPMSRGANPEASVEP